MAFFHRHAPDKKPLPHEAAIVLSGQKVLLRVSDGKTPEFPSCDLVAAFAHNTKSPLHVGLLDGGPCWLYEMTEGEPPLPGYDWLEIRPCITILTAGQWNALGCALTLLWWRNNHRFCGACGTETVEADEERARRCPNCGALFYPSQSAAVIVTVTKNDTILLAHNNNFPSQIHSLIAGFVDPGETLEETVVREIREEVGIEVQNIRYARSQPWPFPNSLMLGFHAEWKSGEIKPDGREIKIAGWFTRDKLPTLPRPGSISRELIDEWVDNR